MKPRRVLHAVGALVLCGMGIGVVAGWAPAAAEAASLPNAPQTDVRVQLKWYDQAQFAGWYAAQDLGYFDDEGLVVTTAPGSPGRNPLDAVLDGRADVGVASMSQAAVASTPERRLVNIAQVLHKADSLLICRARTGFVSERDLRGATIATSSDRQSVVRELYGRLFPDGGQPRFVDQKPDIASLTEGDADCLWGSAFNEYWRVKDAGLWSFAVDPAEYGVVNIEDGLYVDEARLDDPAFRASMVGLLRGLARGWEFAADQPTSVVQMVMTRSGTKDSAAQERQLESLLPLIGDEFGYFDLSSYVSFTTLGAPVAAPELDQKLWTHDIYNAYLASEGRGSFITPTTRFYVSVVQQAAWYQALIGLGVFCFAVSGAFIGLRLGYRFWGRLVLAFLPAAGGGLVRDVLLGGDRYPPPVVYDPTAVYLTIAGAAVVTVVARVRTTQATVERVDVAADRLGAIGFAIFAVHGALVAVNVGAPWVWVLASAALTVAGGGILLDVLVRREHLGFRGAVYEEIAIAAAVLVLAGLWFAGAHEHTPWLVLATVLVAMAATLAVYIVVLRRGITYPARRSGPVPQRAPEPVSATA